MAKRNIKHTHNQRYIQRPIIEPDYKITLRITHIMTHNTEIDTYWMMILHTE